MKCPKCGFILADNSKFCEKCGTKLVNDKVKKVEKKNIVVNNKKNRFKGLKVFLIVILIISLIVLLIRGVVTYVRSLNKIYITSFESTFEKDLEEFFLVEEEVDKLKIKLKTFKSVEKVNIKLYAINLVLYDEEYTKGKKWTIDDLSLPLGSTTLEVIVSLENGKTIERIVTIYNTNEKNLGSLDKKDSDGDKVLNYVEDIYGTDKNKVDTDGDTLSDYDEVSYTYTDPTLFSTYKENVSDALDDYDGDKLNNKKELELGISAIKEDTDNDGLNDYYEIYTSKTDPKKVDTDSDGVSDYDEVINFKSNPLVKTTNFSGKIESDNREVGITLNNISVGDFDKVSFEESGHYVLSSSMAGYIMPAYNIETDIKFTSSTISFNFGDYTLDKNAVPTIYYYNEKTNQLEELKTTINGTTASAVVSHFSTYILVDKNKLGDINQIDSSSGEIKVNDPINGEFVFYYSPVLTSFIDFPIYIMANSSVTEEQIEIMKAKFDILYEGDYEIDFKIIKSDFSFNLLKNIIEIIYKGLYAFMVDGLGLDFLFTSSVKSNGSYIHNINDCLVLGYMNNITDFGNYFVNEDDVNIFTDNLIVIDLDDKTDSNKDGISDAYTKAIVGGAITTETGINPFEGYSYNQIQKNADFDDDSLKNGEEIKVKEKDGKFYIEILSNPMLVDTDEDGLDDPDDESPLVSFIPGFALTNSLKEDVDTSWFENKRDEFNSMFNTGKIIEEGKEKYIEFYLNGEKMKSDINLETTGYGSFFHLASYLGKECDMGDAEKGMKRYEDMSAKTYTEKDLVEPTLNKTGELYEYSIFGSPDVQAFFRTRVTDVMKIAEDNLKNGKTITIKSTKVFTTAGDYLEDYKQVGNVTYFLHGSSGHLISEVTNKDDTYTMKVRYFILDVYDWDRNEECSASAIACNAEIYQFNRMLLGEAKAYMVKIEYDVELTWKKGETPKMVVQEGTPYK